MNNFSLYTFNIYHYLVTARDTLEYVIQRDHSIETYNLRKKILTKDFQDGTPLGDFLKNNGEIGEKIKEKLQSFVDELYSENSTILVPSGNIVRVDRGQLVTLLDMVVGICESLRDIVFQYIQHGMKDKQIDDSLVILFNDDEKMYRTVLALLTMRTFNDSFAEFQKVMNESKGKATPQSNFIVQNELTKLSGFLRFSRQHAHCTDNQTLDLLDEVNKYIEMTEGRRQRPDNKSFQTLYNEMIKKIDEYTAVVEKNWKQSYQNVLEEINKNRKEEKPVDLKTIN